MWKFYTEDSPGIKVIREKKNCFQNSGLNRFHSRSDSHVPPESLGVKLFLGGSSSRFGDVFDVHRFGFHPSHLGQIHPLLNDSSKKFEKTHLTILLDKNSVKNMPLFHQWLLAAPLCYP